MSFDAIKFLHDYHIDHDATGDRSRPGWVQVNCPFCGGGSRGYDLGINIAKEYGHCWLCRGKSLHRVIRALLKCSNNEANAIIQTYHGKPSREQMEKPQQASLQCTLPAGTGPMQQQHKEYLISRNFDPELLAMKYDLQGTGRIGDQKNRIIAPIYFNNVLISYQGREIINRPKVKGAIDNRWKACEKELEVISHQHILYGIDLCQRDVCLLVEGCSDTWRMGPETGGMFGLGYTAQQIALLIKRFTRVFILLDPEPQAQAIADEIAWKLGYAGVEAILVDTEKDVDPGDLSQDDANAFMRELRLKGWTR